MTRQAGIRRLVGGELPAAFLVAAGALLPFLPHVLAGTLPFEDDLPNYFWPVMRHVSEALRAGHLPLWTPGLFGGFPLFADSEAGTLFPLNWIMVFLTGAAGLRTVLMAAIASAALSMYAFARHLDLARAPAAIAAWAFALGGFFTGHLVHVSMLNAAWPLPLVLWSLDRAVTARGVAGRRWVVVAGAAHALQWLGGHVQPPMMTWLLAAAWLAFRIWFSPLQGAPRSHARILVIWAGLLAAMTALALGLAAAQLAPMLELASQGTRAGGMDYAYVSSYAVSPFDLVTLVIPYFFQHDSGVRWSLWASWETAAYVGILPLMLALFAAAAGWRTSQAGRSFRVEPFLAVVAIASLLLALSPYLPLNVFSAIFSLPGLNVLRAPARFVLLFDFAAALLAAYGARRLLNGSHPLSARARHRVAMTAIGAASAICAAVFATAGWIGANRGATITWLETVYAGAPQAGLLLPPERLFDFLQWAVWLGNPRLALALLLLCAAAVWMTAALTGVLAPQARQRIALALVLADLAIYAALFWRPAPLDAVEQPDPVTRLLSTGTEAERVLVAADVPGSANRMFGWGVATVDGYSSLAPRRQAQIVAQARWQSNATLDVLAVSSVLAGEARRQADRSDRLLNPREPIAIVEAGTPWQDSTFLVNEPVMATHLRIVSALEHAPLIEQGAQIGRLTIAGTNGETQVWPIRAGIDTAEWALERADVRAAARHGPAPVALRFDVTDNFGRYPRQLYQTDLDIAHPMSVTSIALATLDARAAWHVFSIDVDERASLQRWDLARFEPIGSDDGVHLYRNLLALPRARLVPAAIVEPDGNRILEQLASPRFDPHRAALLEDVAPHGLNVNDAAGRHACDDTQTCGSVDWQAVNDEHIGLNVRSSSDAWLVLADSWYPGWRAMVDGAEVPLYRANYVQRAVEVPAGSHRIEFVFDPAAVKLGFAVSALSMIAALAVCAARPAGARGGAQ